jgi:hypothetical protein
MKKHTGFMKRLAIALGWFLAGGLCLAIAARGETRTIAFTYSKPALAITTGFRLYQGTAADAVTTKVADFKADAALKTESQAPVLLEEHFDTDPGTKYPLTKGAWSWVPETKNMHIAAGAEFMIVFEKPAGATSQMSFRFWPEKSSSDQPRIESYIKDEAQGAYYELLLGGLDGVRLSSWKKVYNQQWGGVQGAFGLPQYAQCYSGEPSGNITCNGFYVQMTWAPGPYTAEVLGGSAGGNDAHPLDINKLEIIIQNQGGWIDDIVIGGQMELRRDLDLTLVNGVTYLAVSAYNSYGESAKSTPVLYKAELEEVIPGKPKLFRIQ